MVRWVLVFCACMGCWVSVRVAVVVILMVPLLCWFSDWWVSEVEGRTIFEKQAGLLFCYLEELFYPFAIIPFSFVVGSYTLFSLFAKK